ncbi:uncharacterized protein LOC126371356 [Pectinophora gossypiella]|uniref:uncharacterized protein LOC126371356 n=1 Tax=Pectinophora gossypiella TaxID=13191 RepID=UPI00214F205E|nr:uncharacterized protein LOC126371356 [Pectinophora gossypiella]
MGCGSSGQAMSAQGEVANGHAKMTNGNKSTSNGHHDDHDDLPTVVLPDTPAKPKPPIAFEIPLEEFDASRRTSTTPPPHLQRLLQPPQPEISLPDIEEKLAEAEQRRQTILQQRAASAQKRSQKMMKSFSEMDRLDSEHEHANMESLESNKHVNNMHIPPEPGVCEDKNI